MAIRGCKPSQSPSTIKDNLLSYSECFKHYNNNKFTVFTKSCNIYKLSVLEFSFVKIYKLKLFKKNLTTAIICLNFYGLLTLLYLSF